MWITVCWEVVWITVWWGVGSTRRLDEGGCACGDCEVEVEVKGVNEDVKSDEHLVNFCLLRWLTVPYHACQRHTGLPFLFTPMIVMDWRHGRLQV